MIARIWHGWTTPADADAYEELLRTEVLPGIAARGIAGYHGPHLLRRDAGEEGDAGHAGGPALVEFVTILWFDSLEAVRAFAGEDHEEAYVPPAARKLLARFDARSAHYETVLTPEG